jgi:hypothetical protein
MKRLLLALIALPSLFATATAIAQAEYATIELEIEINKSAADAWAAVGEDYCSIADWLEVDCVIDSGDGGMGTVRLLVGGRINEILIAKTELSYGYTQPVEEGAFYILYHGFMEARPINSNRSRMLYTLVYDLSNLPDQAAKDADIARRTAMFETALANMKEIAEAQ